MTTLSGTANRRAPAPSSHSADLARAITRRASTQSYATIRLLADRDRAADAYRAYAYFRWIDDIIDGPAGVAVDQPAFLRRQQALVEAGYQGYMPGGLCPEETLLAELIAGDEEPNSGLRTYLDNMMAVMAIDQERRGRLITAAELDRYIDLLATGVMGALLHFIGHDCPAPRSAARSRAVQGACIIHMLRDMDEDCRIGYYNIPAEYLAAHAIGVDDRDHPAYRNWVAARVALARDCFRDGLAYIAQVGNARCRLAGFAYVARFEWMARLIERDDYRLRATYPERKSPQAGLWMGWRTVSSLSLGRAAGR